MAVVYGISEEPLSQLCIEEILLDLDEKKVSHMPPVRPKAGEIYVFPNELRDSFVARCDHYCWVNSGKHGFPNGDPIGTKTYFKLKKQDGSTTTKFRRLEIKLNVPDIHHFLMHYTGDENEAGEYNPCHGNNVKSNRPFVRQSATVKRSITDASHNGFEPPAKVYRKLTSAGTENEAVFAPRDLPKVKNVLQAERSRRRLSSDEMVNVYLLAHSLGGFITNYAVYPRMICHMFHQPLVEQIRSALKISDDFMLAYDTTFQLGDFFVSTIVFRHSFFEGSPIFPVGFMLHERKYHIDHQRFIAEFFELLGIEKRKNRVPLVTDREFHFSKLPDLVEQAYCWNHILKDVERHALYQGHLPPLEALFYTAEVKKMLQCQSEQEFVEKVKTDTDLWTAPMKQYLVDTLQDTIRKHSGSWVLAELGIRNPMTGVTTNISESMNSVFQRLKQWRERPADAMVMAFHHLCTFYTNEIERSCHGLGNYKVRSEFKTLPAHYLRPSQKFISPEEIVAFLKGEVKVDGAQAFREETSTAADSKQLRSDHDQSSDNQTDVDNVIRGNEQPKFSTTMSLARRILLERKIVLEPTSGSFVVTGFDDKAYAVKLFPKPQCQCLAAGACAHIRAAKMSLGMPDVGSYPKKLTLSQMRKRSRKKNDRTSGRKHFRKNDYEIVAAPDSEAVKRAFVDELNESEDQNQSIKEQESKGMKRQQSPRCDLLTDQVKGSEPPVLNNNIHDDVEFLHTGDVEYSKPGNPAVKLVAQVERKEEGSCGVQSLLAFKLNDETKDRSINSDVSVENQSSALKAKPSGQETEPIFRFSDIELGNKHSSCQTDANFIILLTAACQDQNFYPNLKSIASSKAEKTLLKALSLLSQKKWEEAKETWSSFLGITSGSMFGSQESRFFEPLRRVFEITSTADCSYEDCPGNEKSHKEYDIWINAESDMPILKQVTEKLTMVKRPCSQILTGTKPHDRQRTRLIKGLELDDDGNVVAEYRSRTCAGNLVLYERHLPATCWMLPLRLDVGLKRSRIFAELEPTFEVDGKKFKLRGVTMSTGAHFYAFMFFQGQWYKHDGMDNYWKGQILPEPDPANNGRGHPSFAIYTI